MERTSTLVELTEREITVLLNALDYRGEYFQNHLTEGHPYYSPTDLMFWEKKVDENRKLYKKLLKA